jgi:hypothetical protein
MRISPTGFKVTCARLSTANATVLGSTIPFWPFAALDEKKSERTMAKTVSVIGIEDKELRWIRSLILLLRHPDPSIPELARQALIYLARSAADRPNKSPPAVGRAS